MEFLKDRKWAEILKLPMPKAQQEALALVKRYYEAYRECRNALDRDTTSSVWDQDAVTMVMTSLSIVKDLMEDAKSIDEIKAARDRFADSRGASYEGTAAPIVRAHIVKLRELKEKTDLEEAHKLLRGRQEAAHNKLRDTAQRAPKVYVQDKLICNMVAVAADLQSDAIGVGRAGHGMGRNVFAAAFSFSLPEYPANVHTAQNPYNCAELAALLDLIGKVPGLDMKNVYFAAKVPGGGSNIPPCANCMRWIKETGASAWGM